MPDKTKKPTKKQYLIEEEILVPAILKYRVIAENIDEALLNYRKNNPLDNPRLNLNKARKIRVKVYNWITSKLEIIKDL